MVFLMAFPMLLGVPHTALLYLLSSSATVWVAARLRTLLHVPQVRLAQASAAKGAGSAEESSKQAAAQARQAEPTTDASSMATLSAADGVVTSTTRSSLSDLPIATDVEHLVDHMLLKHAQKLLRALLPRLGSAFTARDHLVCMLAWCKAWILADGAVHAASQDAALTQ
jgi:hypothetical protein